MIVKTTDDARRALELLGKWRMHFAGWLLGTVPKDDPRAQWARDNTEKVLMARVELSALAGLLIDRGVFTAEEFTIRVGQEAAFLMEMFEERWPGVAATEHGLAYDIQTVQADGWMKGWLP